MLREDGLCHSPLGDSSHRAFGPIPGSQHWEQKWPAVKSIEQGLREREIRVACIVHVCHSLNHQVSDSKMHGLISPK